MSPPNRRTIAASERELATLTDHRFVPKPDLLRVNEL
jgi:hypothetical protein